MSQPPRGTDVADIGARGQEEEEEEERRSRLRRARVRNVVIVVVVIPPPVWNEDGCSRTGFRMFPDIDIALTRGYARLTSCFFHHGSSQKARALGSE